MTKHTIETVTIKLNDSMSRAEFAKAAEAITEFVQRQDGFIARRLSCTTDGLWIKHVEWNTLEAAQAAAARIGTEPSLGACMSAIDSSSIVLHHSALELSVS